MMKQFNSVKLLFFILWGTVLVSCKKLVDVDPPITQLTSATVFKNDASATAAELAIYSQMEADGLPYFLALYTGLSADEFVNYSTSTDFLDLYSNNLTSSNTKVSSLWTSLYKYIYQTNAVMEGLDGASGISPSVKQQLLGEAKFTRAFCHFYLSQLFGEIPLALTTDYRENSLLSRKPMAAVYKALIQDLKDAKESLSDNYLSASNTISADRVRPNKGSALALLSRVYLYEGEWALADSTATQLISSTTQYGLAANPDLIFLKNSNEALWQLMPVLPRFNTYEGGYFILTSTPTTSAVRPELLSVFEIGDKRKTSWLRLTTVAGQTFYYPFKYKVGQNASSITEYSMMLRLAEVYLIRAEVRARLNNITGAQSDLNQIRNRAGLPNTTAATQADLLDAIFNERRIEFFAENASRWFDLKRMNRTAVLASLKGGAWQPTDQLYPIPQSELSNNPNLIQNPGY